MRAQWVRDDFKAGLRAHEQQHNQGISAGSNTQGGPWFSNEESKVILILDIQDHSLKQ